MSPSAFAAYARDLIGREDELGLDTLGWLEELNIAIAFELRALPTIGATITRNRLLAAQDRTFRLIEAYMNRLKAYQDVRIRDAALSQSNYLRLMVPRNLRGHVVDNLTELRAEVLATNVQVQGRANGEWWSRQGRGLRSRYSGAIREGMQAGENREALVRRIQGTPTGQRIYYRDSRNRLRWRRTYHGGIMDVTKAQANALVRTSMQEVLAQTRRDFYRVNRHIVTGIMQRSILDTRTTDTCIAYDHEAWLFTSPVGGDPYANMFPIGPKRLQYGGGVPRHWQCRSIELPITGDPEKELPPWARYSDELLTEEEYEAARTELNDWVSTYSAGQEGVRMDMLGALEDYTAYHYKSINAYLRGTYVPPPPLEMPKIGKSGMVHGPGGKKKKMFLPTKKGMSALEKFVEGMRGRPLDADLVTAEVEQLRLMFEKAPANVRVRRPLFRGIGVGPGDPGASALVESLLKNGAAEFEGFVSTSAAQNVASGFAKYVPTADLQRLAPHLRKWGIDPDDILPAPPGVATADTSNMRIMFKVSSRRGGIPIGAEDAEFEVLFDTKTRWTVVDVRLERFVPGPSDFAIEGYYHSQDLIISIEEVVP